MIVSYHHHHHHQMTLTAQISRTLSLSISPYHSSFPAGLPIHIEYLHRNDVSSCWSANTGDNGEPIASPSSCRYISDPIPK